MENKIFQIDKDIIPNKKKSNKPTTKINNNKKTKKRNGFSFFFLIIVMSILIALVFWIKNLNELLIKNFSDGKIIVCKDRLVSKELAYVFNKNENAFINKKEGLFFSVYYCSDYVN